MVKLNCFKIISQKPDKYFDNIALFIGFGSLIFGLIISLFREVGTFEVETDFYGVYAMEAQNILIGKHYTYQHNPPGYCLILAGITYLTKDIFFAGKLISAVATMIFTYINYLLIKYLFEAKIALIITIISLFAIIPSSLVASTDILGASVIITTIWLYLRQKNNRFFDYFWTGIVAGIAYLIRANAIFVSMGIIISLLLINPHQLTIKKRFLAISLFLMGLILIISPWLIYNTQLNGSPFSSTAYAQIAAHFYHPQGDSFITSVNEMSAKFKSFSEVVFYNPVTFLKRYFQDILFVNISSLLVSKYLVFELIKADFSWFQILIIVLPALTVFTTGLFFIIMDNKDKNIWKIRITWLLINLFGYLILGLVGFNRRYYLFLLPLIFLIIIYPVYYRRIFAKFLSKKFGQLTISKLLILGLTFAVIITGCLETYFLLANEPKYLLKIADFLKQKYPSEQTMIVRKPHLAYLSGFKQVFPLAETAEEYLIEAKKVNAKLIVYSDYETKLWPGLKSLKNPQLLPKNFQLIYQDKPSNTLVYEIK